MASQDVKDAIASAVQDIEDQIPIILKHVSAKKIQKWWKKIYFDPNHSVGKKVMERLWEESKDLFKNEN